MVAEFLATVDALSGQEGALSSRILVTCLWLIDFGKVPFKLVITPC